MKKTIPFSINRMCSATLVEQFVCGIRQAISSGWYKPGEILPMRQEFAEKLGVSERVPREGIANLVAEGLVYTRKCLGSIVTEKGERKWLGRVLFVESENYSYYYQALSAAFHRKMTASGYLVSSVFCPLGRSQKTNVDALWEVLSQPLDFAVLPFENPTTVRMLERAKIPYMVAMRKCTVGKYCREVFAVGHDGAIAEFLGRCDAVGAKRVLQVGVKEETAFLDLRKSVTCSKIRLESWFIEPAKCRGPLEDGMYGAMKAFRDRLNSDRKWLPDVLFFLDDFIASGALISLVSAGVRIPEDVRVVTLSNRGNCPVFTKTLTRIEIDPVLNGEVLGEHVLMHLCPSRFRRAHDVDYRFVSGKTF